MKTLLLGIVAASAIIVAACATSLPTPTPVPATATPVAEATATTAPSESGSYVDQIDHVVDPNLVNKTWALGEA